VGAGAGGGVASVAIAVPHAMQKRAPGGAAAPQLGHDSSSAVPHDMQNFAAAGFSVPQFVQVCDAT
jgi:hypothetical protein